MRANLFWFNDEQWAKIEPLLPTRQPGPKPQENRRVLSGIMYVLKVGCRWQDCPPEYGPHKTIYNRFNRWSGRGIWQRIFETVGGSPEPPDEVALDSTHVKAHRCASGGKGGGVGTGDWRHQGRPQQQASRTCRQIMPPARCCQHRCFVYCW